MCRYRLYSSALCSSRGWMPSNWLVCFCPLQARCAPRRRLMPAFLVPLCKRWDNLKSVVQKCLILLGKGNEDDEASISHRCKRNFHNLSQWKEKEKMLWVEKDHPTRLCTDTVDGIYFLYVISPNLRFCGNFLYLAIDEAFRIHIFFFFIVSDGDGKLLLVMMIVLARTICMKYSGSMQLNIE